MRRELLREPTDEEVEEEIRQMGIRKSRGALIDSSSESGGSDISSESYTTEGSGVGGVEDQGPSSFSYLPPAPVPVVRLVEPQGVDPESQGTIWSAVRVDGGQCVPTTVVAHERPSGSRDIPNVRHEEHADVSTTAKEASSGTPVEALEAQEREFEALLSSGAVALVSEGNVGLGQEEGVVEYEFEGVEQESLDHQLAAATLLLHRHTMFEVPSSLDHLTDTQRAIYESLLMQWRESRSEVD